MKSFVNSKYLVILSFLVLSVSVGSCAGNKAPSQEDMLKATSYFNLAISAFSSGDVVEALRALKEVEKYDPNNSEGKNLLGLIFLSKGMHSKAEEQFTEAIRLDPKYSDAYLNLSGVYMAEHKWQKAIDILQFPANDLMYRRKDMVFDNLAWCYSMIGKNDAAIENARKATMENAKFCHAWYTLGRVYKRASLLKEAQIALQKSVEPMECKKFFAAYHELGIVAFNRQDYETAKKALSVCISNDRPFDPKVEECKKYYSQLPD